METKHQYILEKGSKKYYCPNCHKKTFVCYIDTETGDYLPHEYGRCDRESKCAYYLNPYLDGYAKAMNENEKVKIAAKCKSQFETKFQPKSELQPPFAYFDFETFTETLQPERYEKNMFIQNLLYNIPFPFQADEVTKIIELYRLGTVAHGYRAGANTFPFIDIHGNIKAVQVKQFDEKNRTKGTDFLHSIIEKYYTKNKKSFPQWLTTYNRNEKKVTCLFGEHLLKKYPLNPVALVEAPKTAVYGTLYFRLPESPETLIWLAVYNKSSFSWDKLKVLNSRDVFIFPDLSKEGNTFKEWQTKAKEIESKLPGTRFIFSDLLEQLASEIDKNEGYDLADYLIQQDWRVFRKQTLQGKSQLQSQSDVAGVGNVAEKTKIIEAVETQSKSIEQIPFKRIEKKTKDQSGIWNKEIAELEAFFSGIEIPNIPIQINPCSGISYVPKFIKNHLSVVKANDGKRAFSPYLSRLQELKQLLTVK